MSLINNFDWSLAEKLAKRGWVFTSHRKDLGDALGHGKKSKGLLLNEVKKRHSDIYPVIGAKCGVELPNGRHSFIFDADGVGVAEWLEEHYPHIFKNTLKCIGSKPAHYYFELDVSVPSSKMYMPDGKETAADLLSIGKMAVMPTSPHKSAGKNYRVLRDMNPFPLKWKDLVAMLSDCQRHMGLSWPQNDKWNEVQSDLPDKSHPDAEKVKEKLTLFDFGLRAGLQSCPLPGHKNGDRNPSLSVKADGKLFCCYGPHGGGDVISWVMVRDGVDFLEALKTLSKQAGFEIETGGKKEGVLDWKEEIKGALSDTDDKGRPKPNIKMTISTFVRWIISEYDIITVPKRKREERILLYRGGIYQEVGKEWIEQFVRNVVYELELDHILTRNVYLEVVSHLKAHTYINEEKINPAHLLNFKNGVYNITSNKFRRHNPKKDYFTYQLSYDYDSEASCPKFLKFLDEVALESEIPLIQEMFGYCLWPKYQYQYWFMVYGMGSNGKGTLLNLLAHMLGPENCASTSLHELTQDKFASSDLYQRKANICADIGDGGIMDASLLKRLTSGTDYIAAQYKHGNRFEFINVAKLVFSGNTCPEFNDTRDGNMRRIVLISLNKRIEKVNPALGEELQSELSGIFNWAKEGLQRLNRNKKISDSRTVEDVRDEWLKKSNPINTFIEEHVQETNSDEGIPSEEFYEQYKEWAYGNDLPCPKRKEWARNMRRTLLENQIHVQKDRNPPYLWLGLTTNLLRRYH
jgi:P4 family phage/plasmid primase-like protien